MAREKALRLGRAEMCGSCMHSGVSPPKSRGPTSVAEKARKAGQGKAMNGLLPHAKASGCYRALRSFKQVADIIRIHKMVRRGIEGGVGSLVTCGW